jgi:hypothetical protein
LSALAAAFLALALALSRCSWVENARQDAAANALFVAGDYKPLSQCLRGELALQERGVSYAIDERSGRARVWRQLPDPAIGADEFNLLIRQADPSTVTIEPEIAGLASAKDAFLARLQPMVQRCVAQNAATQHSG